MGSSSNRYAPHLPQQETKSSTKLLAPTDPILGPENLLKTGFAQKVAHSSSSEIRAGSNFRGNMPVGGMYRVKSESARNSSITPISGKLVTCNVSSNKRIRFHLTALEFFLGSVPVAFRRVALETPEWTSRDSNHHRQSVSAGKTNAIPTEPSGRLI